MMADVPATQSVGSCAASGGYDVYTSDVFPLMETQ